MGGGVVTVEERKPKENVLGNIVGLLPQRVCLAIQACARHVPGNLIDFGWSDLESPKLLGIGRNGSFKQRYLKVMT